MAETGHYFAQARREKREVFIRSWNPFLRSIPVRIGLSVFSVSGLLTVLFSGSFLRKMCLASDLLQPGYPVWINWILLAIQLLIAVPMLLLTTGLWQVYAKALWQEQTDVSGLQQIRSVNTGICIFTGIAMFFYPTVIIGLGELLPERAILFVFYLFLLMSVILVVCVTLLRAVLRRAEENISCCWANTQYILALLLVIFLLVLMIIFLLPLAEPFVLAWLLLMLATAFLLLLYYRVMMRISIAHDQIDADTIEKNRDIYDDPYTRY